MISMALKPKEDEADYIFRFDGPLGSFSHRIELAYVFGVIDKVTAEQLHLIREMRNACAYSKYKLDFDRAELANVTRRLFRSLGSIELEKSATAENIRAAYIAEFVIIYHILLEGERRKALDAVRDHLGAHFGEQPPSPGK
jgi:hypothetical protein